MSTAIAARRNGDDWQAYLFWHEALFMVNGHDIARVGFEVQEFTAFDDVAVEYKEPRPDGVGGMSVGDYYQVKFSATYAKEISAEALVDPALINADKVSLLERLRDAARVCIRDKRAIRFVLISPWPIKSGDLLAKLVDTTSGAIRFDELRKGKTAKSEAGAVRKLWCDRLEVDETELFEILRYLRIRLRPSTLEDSRRNLNHGLSAAGFTPISDFTQTDPYSSLIWKLEGQKKQWITASDIREVCTKEGLCLGKPAAQENPPRVLGVRTFLRWAENLEDETDSMVCLTDNFSQRHIKEHGRWAGAVLPGLRSFFSGEIVAGKPIELELQTHSTVAFATGYLIEPKAGVQVGIRQRGISGVSAWKLERKASHENVSGDGTVVAKELKLGAGPQLACAIGITHPIEADVRNCLSGKSEVGELLSVSVPHPSAMSVKDGHHAFELAEAIINAVRAKRSTSNSGPLHLFMAVPNGLAFLLGQLARVLGTIQVYEFDFGGTHQYSESIVLEPSYSLEARG
jgi:hypothetical protein